MDNKTDTPASQAPAGAFPSTYQPPRLITHSAEGLDGLTLHVNACTSAFGAAKSTDDSKDEESVVY
jgi:hypothetical protein